MAQASYTPIQLYYSTTAAAVPVNTNLANGELAINITDGKLYYKDNGGTVRLLASNATSAPVLSFQTSLSGLTPSTATTGVVTLAGTLNTTSGGTGLASYTAGDLAYYASGTALTKLGIGTNGQLLTSSGTAPQWTSGSSITVGIATNLAGGAAGSVPYQSGASTTTFLSVGTANQVLTSSGTAPQWSSAITVTGVTDSGSLTFTGTGNRITGDFSNATVANRVMLQSTTVNGNTGVGAIPNGTAATSAWQAFSKPDPTNSSEGALAVTDGFDVRISSGIRGTGTYLPMTFYTGGGEKVRIDTSGNVGIGTTAPSVKLEVNVSGTTGNGINCGDFTSSAQSTIPSIQSLGSRVDANATFQGRFGASLRRTDGTAIASTQNIGMYAFGGQWGTDTSYQSAKLLYPASIKGVAEGSFTSATAMPTAITFSTGSTGDVLGSVNLTYGTERMRIDSSGNVGIGLSNPASKLYVTTSSTTAYGLISQTPVVGLVAGNSVNMAYITNGRGSNNDGLRFINYRDSTGSGSGDWPTESYAIERNIDNVAPQASVRFGLENLRFDTSGTERMRIDSSGNVGIGTTAPSQKLEVYAAANSLQIESVVRNDQAGSGVAAIGFNVSSSASAETTSTKAGIGLVRTDPYGVGSLCFYNNVTGSAGNFTTADERMRIDNSGNLLVGTTSSVARTVSEANGASLACLALRNSDTGTASQGIALFYRNGSLTGNISNTNTATSYNTSSDYRLKNTIAPMTGALDKVALLKPCTYKWNADNSDGQGFIAHELQEVVGGCVTGEKDATREEEYEVTPAVPAVVDAEGVETTPAVQAVKGTRTVPSYQGVDTSFLVATLTAAIQEAHALIIQLQADVAALKR